MSRFNKRALAATITAASVGTILIGLLRNEVTIMLRSSSAQEIDFAIFERDERPNQYLVAPEGLCSTPVNADSPVFDVSIEKLKHTWVALMQTQPRLEDLGQFFSGDQYEYVQRSRWMRFPDFISVRFISVDANRSTLAIFSQSRIGYSDFGVNEERVTSWLRQLRERLPLDDSHQGAT